MSRALELTGIHKRFGSVQALRGADFSLESGEVHALLGENGAGKSTLMHIAYRLVQPDSGEISVSGERQRIRSPRRARSLGHRHGAPTLHIYPGADSGREHRAGSGLAGDTSPAQSTHSQAMRAHRSTAGSGPASWAALRRPQTASRDSEGACL